MQILVFEREDILNEFEEAAKMEKKASAQSLKSNVYNNKTDENIKLYKLFRV